MLLHIFESLNFRMGFGSGDRETSFGWDGKMNFGGSECESQSDKEGGRKS